MAQLPSEEQCRRVQDSERFLSWGFYARQGRTEEMKELAGAMLPIFKAADVHRAALAALAVFQQAAAQDAAMLELVEEVDAFLERARHDPGLRFGGE